MQNLLDHLENVKSGQKMGHLVQLGKHINFRHYPSFHYWKVSYRNFPTY